MKCATSKAELSSQHRSAHYRKARVACHSTQSPKVQVIPNVGESLTSPADLMNCLLRCTLIVARVFTFLPHLLRLGLRMLAHVSAAVRQEHRQQPTNDICHSVIEIHGHSEIFTFR